MEYLLYMYIQYFTCMQVVSKKVCIYLLSNGTCKARLLCIHMYVYVCICMYMYVHVLYSACITRGHCLAHVTKFWDQGTIPGDEYDSS